MHHSLTLLASLALALASPAPSHTPSCSSSDNGDARVGAVATQSDTCSHIGTQLLKDGGNAVDAMVGVVFCVGVIGMFHSGIGGGGFMLVRLPNKGYEYIDFRETAPAAATQDMYNNDTNLSIFGGMASGVPGQVKGLEYAHKKHGALPWQYIVKPSVKVAREGFTVTQDLVDAMEGLDFLKDDPAWAIDFAPQGRLVKLGEIMTRKRLADTLEAIATGGSDAFYTGPIANATIRALRASKGIMTLEDLKNYTAITRDALSINYRGYKLASTGAPSSGAVALSALNTVSGYDDFFHPDSVNISTHRLDEAMRFAYGQRTSFGDPSFVAGLDNFTHNMLTAATGAEIRSKISDKTSHNVSWYDPKGIESLNTPGTSHMVTADASGMAVSLTTTINLLFGSQLIVPETGVIMNNEMNDFSIPGSSNAFGYIPSPANYIRPGKRPLSSISPIIAETADGRLYFVTGAAGGSRITSTNIQTMVHALDEKLDPLSALRKPRFHDQLVPNQAEFEWTFDNSTVDFMRSVGHNVTWVKPGFSLAQAIRLLSNGTFEASGEPRMTNSGGYAV